MSSQVIPADFVIDEVLVKKILSTQFGLTIHQCQLIGEGFDNAVFLVNEHLVFRFPRRKVAVGLIEHEIRFLSKLSGLFDIAIPKPIFVGLPSLDFGAPFYGHEFLPGRTGCSVRLSLREQHDLAYTLGSFLYRLHNIDISKLAILPEDLTPLFDRVNKEQMTSWLFERFDAVKKPFALANYEHKINEIAEHAQDYIPRQGPLVPVHGDLYHRHLLFNERKQLCGVIDWGDSCLSDRVVDFSVVYQFLAKETHETFFIAYGPVSEGERAYGRFLGLYYTVTMLWFGFDRHDKALISTSLATLASI